MNYKSRIEKVREFLEKKRIETVLTKNPSHIFYLTGLLEIEGVLLVNKKEVSLFLPEMYYNECLDKIGYNKKLINLYKYKTFKRKISGCKIHFIETEFTYSSINLFQKEYNVKKLFPIGDFLLEIRMVKDEKEIELINKAKEIAKITLRKIKENIKEGISELDIVAEIHYYLRKFGARKEAFPPIVSSGVNSSYPHHKSQNKPIKSGEVIVIDIGADFCGYKSDLTSTFFLGKPKDLEIEKIYRIVKEVYKNLVEKVKINMSGRELYQIAVEIFKKYNLKKFFIHGLGHGVGIDVHEKPVLNSKSKDILKKNTVFTIEPGIYLPHIGGVRIEETFFMI